MCLSVKRTINDVDDKANGKPSAGVATLERNSVLPIRLWASTRHSHSQRKKWRLLRTRAGWSLGDTSRSAKKKKKVTNKEINKRIGRTNVETRKNEGQNCKPMAVRSSRMERKRNKIKSEEEEEREDERVS